MKKKSCELVVTHMQEDLFAELAKTQKTSGLACEAIKFYRKLYAVESEARDNKLTAEERYQLRQEKSIPVLINFKKWLDYNLPKTSGQGAIGKAIRYCVGNWVELNSYLQDGRVEIDNNLVENAIRPFVWVAKIGCSNEGLQEVEYPFHNMPMTVTYCGRICLKGKKINFSTAFAGQTVGIKEVDDNIWLVSFMQYDLGYYFDEQTCKLEPLDNGSSPNKGAL